MKDVDLALDPTTQEIRIPVVIELETSRLGLMKGEDELGFLSTQVERGLRARLATNNLLTGQKSIDFDFLEGAAKAEIRDAKPYAVLPTAGGAFDAITDRITRIVEKVDRLPLESIGKNLDEAKIRKSLDLSMWDKLERSYVIGRNINRAYLEIEADSFDE